HMLRVTRVILATILLLASIYVFGQASRNGDEYANPAKSPWLWTDSERISSRLDVDANKRRWAARAARLSAETRATNAAHDDRLIRDDRLIIDGRENPE